MNAFQKTGYILARVIAPIAIVALGIGGLLVFGQKPAKQEKPPEALQNTIVEVTTVESFDEAFIIEVEGVALPLRQVQTSAQVAGVVTVKSAACRGGRYVEIGQQLIEVDPTDYQLEQERLQAQLAQADESQSEVAVDIENTRSLIELAEEEATLQNRNLQRVTEIYGRKASTDSALDTARREELVSRNAVQTLQNQLKTQQQKLETLKAARKLAATQLKQADADLNRTKIVAPVSGTIVTTSVEQGDYVKVGDPLFRTNDTDDMEVSCQLRIDELYWIWLQAGTFGSAAPSPMNETFEIPKTPVEIAYEFKGIEYLWSGELSRYDGTGLDPSTRTVPCRVLVKEPTDVRIGGNGRRGLVAPPTLFSGMYVKVRLAIDPPISLVAVPTSAVQPGGEVWLAREGALDIEQVTVARTHADKALIIPTPHGPQPGDSIIVSPMAGPTQGMSVTPISPHSPLERAAAEANSKALLLGDPAGDISL